ncbi:hypothetical protein KJ359_008391 [Pestalotiopsis sp. 9143b]|nr:hypothetical protein KJ359_008391 [Pestalotiopsis sp. 9143b]
MEYSSLRALDKFWSGLWNTDTRYSQIPDDEPRSDSPTRTVGGSRNHEGGQQPWHLPDGTSRWLWRISPWFIAAAFGKTQRRLPKKTPTSHLNGIRGIACVIVYLFHGTSFHDKFFYRAYGAEPAEENHYFTQLPIIRVMYAGKAMVAVFFVLSGFVLSYSPLQSMTEPSPSSDSALVTGLCSSILRRGVRLFAPMVAMITMTCLMTWFYMPARPWHLQDDDHSLIQHIWQYVKMALPLFNLYDWTRYTPSSFDHCWTLAAEFRGSMAVFLMCIATARLSTAARKVTILFTAVWALLQHGRGDLFSFLVGMLLAECRHRPLSEDLTLVCKTKRKIRRPLQQALAVCLLLASLVAMGWPEDGHGGVEPYKTMAALVPDRWAQGAEDTTSFWGYVAAPGLLVAIDGLPAARRLLSAAPMLYLGEVSYSFYLLHWAAFALPGRILMDLFTGPLGWSRTWGMYAMLLGTCVVLLWAADLFWRTIDEGCVRLARGFVGWLGVYGPREPPRVSDTTSPVEVQSLEMEDMPLMKEEGL